MIMPALPGNAEMEYKYRQYAKQATHQILSSHGIVTHETQLLIIHPVSLLDCSYMSTLYRMSVNTPSLLSGWDTNLDLIITEHNTVI